MQVPVPQAATPAKKSKAPVIIVIVIVVLVLCGCVPAVAGLLVYRSGGLSEFLGREESPPVVAPIDAVVTEGTFGTPQEAAESAAPDGWVVELRADNPDVGEYWAGPPASEWVTAILVAPTSDGRWVVSQTYPIEGGYDVPATDDQLAQYAVEEFLIAIMEDRPMEAQALTIEPFKNDPASAQVSAGAFQRFEILSVDPAGDGTYWVKVTEYWDSSTDTWRYQVVPTEAGWRIRDLTPG
jgi:hypothetical protein